jgi:hypothetical protein
MKKIIFASIIVSLAVLFRTKWHIYPNVELVTAATLLASVYLGRKWGILVPIVIMAISDSIIGNTNIFIFTWSAYILMGLIARGKPWMKAITASLFFFVWTNFGVWAMDSFGMYSKDLSGLLRCYFMGLPFLRFNLVGNLILVPVSFWLVERVRLFFVSWIWSRNRKQIG